MEQITLCADGKTIVLPYARPRPLFELIAEAGCSIAAPCGGNGRCGKCKVQAYGALSPLTPEEERLLCLSDRLDNWRLACQAQALGSCRLLLPTQSAALRVTTQGTAAACFDGPASFAAEGWALAVDLGTTTIAVYLLNLSQPEQKNPPARGERNAQAAFGADVISRIEQVGILGIDALRRPLLHQLDRLFTAMLLKNHVPAHAVRAVVLTGNTTMLHLAAGLDPAGIAVSPYTPQSLFGVQYMAQDFFAALPGGATVYLAPCIGGYVGGDLCCAAVACGLQPGDLLLDIGTNGEMLLETGEELLCCAAAAGPAFEGANLRFGMPAAAGAIAAVALAREGLRVRTIGDLPAVGICGGGAISALAALRRLGAIDESGCFSEDYMQDGFCLAPGVFLTPQDIRQLQLAKAAIAAGLDTLLYRADLPASAVRRVLLAGGFGTAIDAQAAAEIGLLPPVLAAKVASVGNAAGMGACLCARRQGAIDEAERIAARAKELSLSDDAYFTERFVEQMFFPALAP